MNGNSAAEHLNLRHEGQERVSSFLYSDGSLTLRFTDSKWVPPPSMIDILKASIERKLGAPVDWWPLQRVNYRCPPEYTRVSWESCDEELSVDIPEALAHEYRTHCKPVPLACTPSLLLPTYNLSSNPPSHITGEISPTVQNAATGSQTPRHTLSILDQTTTGQPDQSTLTSTSSPLREIYWCVNDSWSEPKGTWLCCIKDADKIPDDAELCRRLNKEYNRIQGVWGRLFSWKTCVAVEFTNFYRIFSGEDLVVTNRIGLPSTKFYEYSPRGPKSVHMIIATKLLIEGMHKPAKVTGKTLLLPMVPKKKDTPLKSRLGAEGWGMHAIHGFSLRKIFTWVAVLAFVELVFVIVGFVQVGQKYLQAAFIPTAYFMAMVFLGLAIPQVLGVA